MAKSPTFDVTDSEGRIIGSLRPRGTGFQFRCKINGQRQDHTLKKIQSRELAIKEARDIWQRGGAAAVPLPAPIVAPTPRAENLGRVMVKYLRGYKKENRRSSWQRIRPTLASFLAHVGGWRVSPDIITRKHIKAFRDLRAETTSPATANSDTMRVKVFCRWLQDEEYLPVTRPLRVKRLKVRTIAKVAISSESVQDAIEAFGEDWLRDLALILANVGLRPQEGLHLRVCDFNERERLLYVRAWERDGYKWQIKDNEDRALEVNVEAGTAILRRRMAVKDKGHDALLFPSPAGKPWDYDNFAKVWRKALPTNLRGVVTPYELRHYFATGAHRDGWPIEKLSKYLGHSSVLVTERYYVDKKAMKIGAPPVLATERREAAQG